MRPGSNVRGDSQAAQPARILHLRTRTGAWQTDRRKLARECVYSETVSDLQRFKDAQQQAESGFVAALAELRAGGKQGHWIWFIFPQLSGLGRSPQAERYGLADLDEALDYLRDPVLRERLLAVTATVAALVRAGQPLVVTMGSSVDTLKLVSSLTLFEAAAARLAGDADVQPLLRSATTILDAAVTEGYPRCSTTQHRLALLRGAESTGLG